jgi:hypothetical protein
VAAIISPLMDHPTSAIDRNSAPAEKVALFRSLFRGRDDVYPRRFESRKTGKAGYAPACANEWVRGICEKPRIKCAVCLKERCGIGVPTRLSKSTARKKQVSSRSNG